MLTVAAASWRLEILSWSINKTILHAQAYLVWLCVRPAFLMKQRHVGPKLVVQKQLSMHFRSGHLAASQQSTPYATFGQHAMTQHVHRFSLPFGSLGPTWALLTYTLPATKPNATWDRIRILAVLITTKHKPNSTCSTNRGIFTAKFAPENEQTWFT